MHVPAYCTLVYKTMSTMEVANWKKLCNVGFRIRLSPFWGWGGSVWAWVSILSTRGDITIPVDINTHIEGI